MSLPPTPLPMKKQVSRTLHSKTVILFISMNSAFAHMHTREKKKHTHILQKERKEAHDGTYIRGGGCNSFKKRHFNFALLLTIAARSLSKLGSS